MTDTAILARDVEVVQAAGPGIGEPAFSWSAAIAGALTATAVTFILISLGSGIGFSLASPFSGPSAATLTIGGAIWLVLAQAWGFAVGGYLAGRMRARSLIATEGEANFRDGAQGLLVWAIGVILTTAVIAIAGAATARIGATVAATAQTSQTGQLADPAGYYVDSLFRTPAATTAPADEARVQQQRAEATRILARSLAQGRMAEEDRNYLARLVSERTGASPEDANRRVADVETKAREEMKQAADKAAKAAAYLSFWTFLSLLFGAVAATLGGILGGNQRDAEWMGGKTIG